MNLAIPTELPIAAHQAEIQAALEGHAVVIVAGETGSGKTTQLPKICLAAGRGQQGLIGHTQPRRIAARAVATRIAEELQTPLGEFVGLKTRFDERTGPNNAIRLMTDGILLAEICTDPWLRRYDTLIIDEAHERSLNIDFLLGYLKRLLQKRTDLKLIITSATIDPLSFSSYFNDAPIIEVSGRGYPVSVYYRSLLSDDPDISDQDLPQAILSAVRELQAQPAGDILVFLSGEREIRETAKFLREAKLRDTEILPLYGRLSQGEQDRIFKAHIGSRVVLATNVAETSLTVPGIHFVIDTGLARMSEYNYRYKVQRLPIAKISQASADQRKGRCGRVAPGICLRLYEEADFIARPRFTKPEILRTNLAGVILQMLNLRLGAIEDFPLLDKPDPRYIKAGYQLLIELGAITLDKQITALGKQMSRLPLDPKLSRIVLAGQAEHCLTETLIIVSALSIQDPREVPHEAKQQAQQSHKQYADPQSDFLSWLHLWNTYEKERQALGSSQLRKYCKAHYLSYTRMREWQEVHNQLLVMTRQMQMSCNGQPADYLAIHRALLTGLLASIGLQDEDGTYKGVRELRFQIFPGSGLFKKKPRWLMAAEILETSKVYAHCVAEIDPEWIEQVAQHLVKRSYSDPHWEKKRGQVVATERVNLFGLLLSAKRKVNYGEIEPLEAREIFIKDGLVANEVVLKSMAFLEHNQTLIAEIEAQEEKARRRDILVDSEVIYNFYAERIPENIIDVKLFNHWYGLAHLQQTRLLFLQESDLMNTDAAAVTVEQFPECLTLAEITLKLTYRFEPGHPEDGVTAIIPVTLLNQLDPLAFEWLVPGLLEKKILALLKCLPKEARRYLNPLAEYAEVCAQVLIGESNTQSLTALLSAQLNRMTGVKITSEAWQLEKLPPELQMNFHFIDNAGKTLQQGRDFAELKDNLQGHARSEQRTLSATQLERSGITTWDFGELPLDIRSNAVKFYPGLIDEKNSVALHLFDSEMQAAQENQRGLARLFYLATPRITELFNKQFPKLKELALSFAAIHSYPEFLDEVIMASISQAFLAQNPTILNQTQFEHYRELGSKKLMLVAQDITQILERIKLMIQAFKQAKLTEPCRDIVNARLGQRIHAGFISHTPHAWLQRLPIYLKALQIRIEKYPRAPQKDILIQQELESLHKDYEKMHKKNPCSAELQLYYWYLEEYQISLFAQELKTILPMSKKRLLEQLDKVQS